MKTGFAKGGRGLVLLKGKNSLLTVKAVERCFLAELHWIIGQKGSRSRRKSER